MGHLLFKIGMAQGMDSKLFFAVASFTFPIPRLRFTQLGRDLGELKEHYQQSVVPMVSLLMVLPLERLGAVELGGILMGVVLVQALVLRVAVLALAQVLRLEIGQAVEVVQHTTQI